MGTAAEICTSFDKLLSVRGMKLWQAEISQASVNIFKTWVRNYKIIFASNEIKSVWMKTTLAGVRISKCTITIDYM